MKQPATEIKPQFRSALAAYILLISACLLLQANHALDWASLSLISIQNGEYWRLFTAHLIHLDWEHFAMNIIGMGLCILAFQSHLPAKHWLLSFVFIALFSSLCLLASYDPYKRYMGFSDVLHGWILLGALSIAREEFKLSLAIFVLFWIKILEENLGLQFFTSGNLDSTHIATESHLYGAIGGMLYGAAYLFFTRAKAETNNNSSKDPKNAGRDYL